MITFAFVIAIIVAIGNGETLTAFIGAFVVLFLIGMIASGHKEDKAYVNVVDYWADGGPDRKGR